MTHLRRLSFAVSCFASGEEQCMAWEKVMHEDMAISRQD